MQAVAKALLALPTMPSGVLACPADLGVVYHLVFFVGDGRLAPVSIDAPGCETVRGLGVSRWGRALAGLVVSPWPGTASREARVRDLAR